jgi:hypothetical protein
LPVPTGQEVKGALQCQKVLGKRAPAEKLQDRSARIILGLLVSIGFVCYFAELLQSIFQ